MRALGFLLAFALVACGSAESVVPMRSSPLLAVDADRLWILLQAARINPRCREYYANPANPRLAGLDEKCAEAERNAVAWLHANGVADARVEDLRAPAFWTWHHEKVKAIDSCRAVLAPGSPGYWTRYNGCDPFEQIAIVEKRNVADAGYQVPQGQ